MTSDTEEKVALSIVGIALLTLGFWTGWVSKDFHSEYTELKEFKEQETEKRLLENGWHRYKGLLIPPRPPRPKPAEKKSE